MPLARPQHSIQKAAPNRAGSNLRDTSTRGLLGGLTKEREVIWSSLMDDAKDSSQGWRRLQQAMPCTTGTRKSHTSRVTAQVVRTSAYPSACTCTQIQRDGS